VSGDATVLFQSTYFVDSLVLVWLESRLVDGNALVDIDDLIRRECRHGLDLDRVVLFRYPSENNGARVYECR
jgi:hypothetical protein